jgi:hypothetical protein
MKTRYEPEWAREKEITARFGMTHMILYNLRKRGAIRSVSLRDNGAKYGARLFHVGSIRSYLELQEAKEIAEQSAFEERQT